MLFEPQIGRCGCYAGDCDHPVIGITVALDLQCVESLDRPIRYVLKVGKRALSDSGAPCGGTHSDLVIATAGSRYRAMDVGGTEGFRKLTAAAPGVIPTLWTACGSPPAKAASGLYGWIFDTRWYEESPVGAAHKIDYTYRYPFASFVGEGTAGGGLRLATCDAAQGHPHFFEGRIRQPRIVADMLLALSTVVRSHFYIPNLHVYMDPVVTSSEEVLRFEGFSGCCGVYARVDLPAGAFDADLQRRGTTNVDFNNPMRLALARLRDHNAAHLAVGGESVTLTSGGTSVIEKKVKLPVRWIKGFSEVQVYQPSLRQKFEISSVEGLRFIRSLPRGGAPRSPSWVTPIGRGLRLSQRESKDGVRVQGTDRLRVIEPLLHEATTLRIWADDHAGTSAWEVQYLAGRFFFMLSPEPYRGFSGEGQLLELLAGSHWKAALPQVRAELAWQSAINVGAVAKRTGLTIEQVETSLAALGARGLAGYDLSTGRYFHRELPFDMSLIDLLQPRLKSAKKVLAEHGVRLISRAGSEAAELMVAGTGVDHRVRLLPAGDRCSCPWFSKYQGQRGPCKHILAARIFVEGMDEEA